MDPSFLPPFPGLAVLHELGEEERERGEADLLLAARQALVQDGRLGPDHRRGRRGRGGRAHGWGGTRLGWIGAGFRGHSGEINWSLFLKTSFEKKSILTKSASQV